MGAPEEHEGRHGPCLVLELVYACERCRGGQGEIGFGEGAVDAVSSAFSILWVRMQR